jgi:hypothetical protein
MAIFDPSQFKPDNLTLENFPLGRHVVFISDAKPHTSKSGTQAIEIDFYIHDPASPHKGRSLRFSKFWTSEKALPRLANLCRACATPVAVNATSAQPVKRFSRFHSDSPWRIKTSLYIKEKP